LRSLRGEMREWGSAHATRLVENAQFFLLSELTTFQMLTDHHREFSAPYLLDSPAFWRIRNRIIWRSNDCPARAGGQRADPTCRRRRPIRSRPTVRPSSRAAPKHDCGTPRPSSSRSCGSVRRIRRPCRDAHDRLVFRFSAVNTFFRTAQVDLIHLDAALEAIPTAAPPPRPSEPPFSANRCLTSGLQPAHKSIADGPVDSCRARPLDLSCSSGDGYQELTPSAIPMTRAARTEDSSIS